MSRWDYENWPSGEPYDWSDAGRGPRPFDNHDFHVDLGCGRVKKGRIGIDHREAPEVDFVCNLETLEGRAVGEPPGVVRYGLPFEEGQVQSMISHHCLEHIGEGFLRLMDEVYRVLAPDALFRIIVPLFPSYTAVADPDHKRYFMEGTFGAFCGTPGDTPQNCWLASFSVPYTSARFEMVEEDISPPAPLEKMWTPEDAREMRVALIAKK